MGLGWGEGGLNAVLLKIHICIPSDNIPLFFLPSSSESLCWPSFQEVQHTFLQPLALRELREDWVYREWVSGVGGLPTGQIHTSSREWIFCIGRVFDKSKCNWFDDSTLKVYIIRCHIARWSSDGVVAQLWITAKLCHASMITGSSRDTTNCWRKLII